MSLYVSLSGVHSCARICPCVSVYARVCLVRGLRVTEMYPCGPVCLLASMNVHCVPVCVRVRVCVCARPYAYSMRARACGVCAPCGLAVPVSQATLPPAGIRIDRCDLARSRVGRWAAAALAATGSVAGSL